LPQLKDLIKNTYYGPVQSSKSTGNVLGKNIKFECTGNFFSDFLALYDLLGKYGDGFNTITIEGRGKNIEEAVELAILAEKIISFRYENRYLVIDVDFKIDDINLTSEVINGKMQSVIMIKLKCNVSHAVLCDDYGFYDPF